MSSPEASIEEILASIRKTFTDEPEAQGAKSAESYAEARPSGMPPFRSVTETALPAGTTSLPTPPRSRAAAIDDDLDDLIDKSSQMKSPSDSVRAGLFRSQPSLRRLLRCLLLKLPARNGLICSTRTASPTAPLPKQPKSNPKQRPSPRRLLPHLPPPPLRAFLRRAKAASTHRRTRARTPFCRCPQRLLPPRRHPLKTHHLQRRHSVRLPHQRRSLPPASAAPRPGFIPFPQTKPQVATAPAPAPATLSGATMAMTAPAAAAPAVSPASASVADVPAASARALDDLVAELNSVAHVPAESVAPAPVVLSEPWLRRPPPRPRRNRLPDKNRNARHIGTGHARTEPKPSPLPPAARSKMSSPTCCAHSWRSGSTKTCPASWSARSSATRLWAANRVSKLKQNRAGAAVVEPAVQCGTLTGMEPGSYDLSPAPCKEPHNNA